MRAWKFRRLFDLRLSLNNNLHSAITSYIYIHLICLGHETAKGPLRSSSQAVTYPPVYQYHFTKLCRYCCMSSCKHYFLVRPHREPNSSHRFSSTRSNSRPPIRSTAKRNKRCTQTSNHSGYPAIPFMNLHGILFPLHNFSCELPRKQ